MVSKVHSQTIVSRVTIAVSYSGNIQDKTRERVPESSTRRTHDFYAEHCFVSGWLAGCVCGLCCCLCMCVSIMHAAGSDQVRTKNMKVVHAFSLLSRDMQVSIYLHCCNNIIITRVV